MISIDEQAELIHRASLLQAENFELKEKVCRAIFRKVKTKSTVYKRMYTGTYFLSFSLFLF